MIIANSIFLKNHLPLLSFDNCTIGVVGGLGYQKGKSDMWNETKGVIILEILGMMILMVIESCGMSI